VDRVIEARQAHVMAHRLGLGEAGQVEGRPALEAAKVGGVEVDLRQVDSRMFAVAELEDQRLVGEERGATGADAGGAGAGGTALCVHAHFSASVRPAQSALMSSSVVSSVAARITRSVTCASSGMRRET